MFDKHEPPRGTRKHITVEEYESLSEDKQWYYQPQWRRYRTVKRRKYETCNLGHEHYMGWDIQTTGVGKPYRYEWRRPAVPYHLHKMRVEAIRETKSSHTVADFADHINSSQPRRAYN